MGDVRKASVNQEQAFQPHNMSDIIMAILVIAVLFVLSNFWRGKASTKRKSTFQPILDNFKTIEEVQKALREAGLEASQLIVGIDHTKSNEWQGQKTFGGRCLHHLGDESTRDQRVFRLGSGDCDGVQDLLKRYNTVTPKTTLSGPTSFAPLIREAIKIVRETREYHILLIVADGQVSNERETVDAIVEASDCALSIVLVGVGDGPWDKMEEFDDGLPRRRFDNFQFVDFHKTMQQHQSDAAFALSALMEIPDQYKAIRELHLLGKAKDAVDVVD